MANSNPFNVELEAAKLLRKLIQDSKYEPTKLATKLYVISQHMRSSGRENSRSYQVMSRAMETVIKQNGLDIEALKSSRLPLAPTSQVGEAGSSQGAGEAELGEKLTAKVLKISDDELDSFEICRTINTEIYAHPEFVDSAGVDNCVQQNEVVESPLGDDMGKKWQPDSSCPQQTVKLDAVAGRRNVAGVENHNDNLVNRHTTLRTLDIEYGITREILEQHSGKKLQDVADFLGVSGLLRSVYVENIISLGGHPVEQKKHNCSGTHREFVQTAEENNEESSPRGHSLSKLPIEEVHTIPDGTPRTYEANTTLIGATAKDDSTIIVKVMYKDDIVKFWLPLSSGKIDLEEEVAQRFNLSLGSFKLNYLDDEDDWILVTCDADLKTCTSMLRLQGRTTVKMRVCL